VRSAEKRVEISHNNGGRKVPHYGKALEEKGGGEDHSIVAFS